MTGDLKRESRPGAFTFISFLTQYAIVMGPMFMLIMSSERMRDRFRVRKYGQQKVSAEC